ncbi:MAG: glycosyltransferase family 39 protein, partial [Candidatus Levybacteria bacterium]|nr:glycosyltransferase family 39 protein [Candidatus Levybacteria bacterium]
MFEKKRYLFLLLVFLGIITFVPRLYRFDNPIADWHSWRQADTSSVTRNFVKEGYTPFYPKFDTLNSLNELNLDNPKRYFFAELPIYNTLQYAGYVYIGQVTLEEWGRLISILAATFTTVILFLLVAQYSSQRVALFAAVLYAILPFNIYYGRVILADPLHIFFSVFALYLVTLWIRYNNIFLAILAGVVFGGALLTKPYALVLFLPIGYLLFRAWGFGIVKKIAIYLFVVLALVPFLLWRWHINNYPEGMFGTLWLYNQGGIRFTGAYFRWLIFDRMNRLIFATGGFVLFWLGVIRGSEKKEGYFYYLWLAAILVFFVVIARGNVTHDYYQMPLVPIGCIFMAKGIDFLLSLGNTKFQRGLNAGVAVILVLLLLAFGWFEVRGYFNINNPAIVAAG